MSNSAIPYRKLRGYAFDPSLSLQLETIDVNAIVYKVPWESLEEFEGKSFPRGEYVEIIDYDPASEVFYPPVDLDDHMLVLQEGLSPDVNNPQFHQQMVYAVTMTTIKNFEQALGRKIQWSDRFYVDDKEQLRSDFVERLRIYPHALTQANAYYSPEKKALLFGYFDTGGASAHLGVPSTTVFTCLSHDIIAHETTHAILDGLHRRYIEPSNPDTRAFHEAFADLVALFQHFTFPEVLRHQIAKTRGDLESQNLLGQLAQEFGKALGSYGSLRDAIGHYDKEKKQWQLNEGDSFDYQNKMGFHERGSILVAAVFNAFLSIYKRRSRPILRIASGGSGVLAEGELHPDLVNELANIAAKTAGHMLRMCVRALDYSPPVDITFGEFLRALITADLDFVAEDTHDYRVAFIEAFQKRGIFPKDLKNISVDSLSYPANPLPDIDASLFSDELNVEKIFVNFLREFRQDIGYQTNRKIIHELTGQYIAGSGKTRMGLHRRINTKFIKGPGNVHFTPLTGLLFPPTEKECIDKGVTYSKSTVAKYQIGNVWLASRAAPDGKIVNHVIITMIQKRGVIGTFKGEEFIIAGYFNPSGEVPENGLVIRGGCTLIFDLDTLCLKYAIKKDIDDLRRIELQFQYQKYLIDGQDGQSIYFDNTTMEAIDGPFAFMHNHAND
ncbi:hypothetical protein A0256_08895 [Mucilaginibacter sp. PAMC 26640]|nr:hypothetical protein A0256_08895 [Mucilaginibacter sp. PAMC 26640]